MRRNLVLMLSIGMLVTLGTTATAQDKYNEAKAEQEAYRKAIEANQRRQAAATEQVEEARKLLDQKLLELRQREIGGKEKARDEKKSAEKRPAESLEAKIELLLKEMKELRKDVNEIKSKLQGPAPNYWQQYGPYFPSKNLEKKKEEKIEIDNIRKKQDDLIEAARDRAEIERQRAEQARKAAERADLERRLDQLMRQADELRRAIDKTKSK